MVCGEYFTFNSKQQHSSTASIYIFAWPLHYLLQIPFKRAKAFLNINRLNNEINRSLNERTDDRKPSVLKLPLFEKDQLFVIWFFSEMNISNSSNETESEIIFISEAEQKFSLIFCSLIALLTIGGNVLVIVAFATRSSLRKIRSNVFIFSLGKINLNLIFWLLVIKYQTSILTSDIRQIITVETTYGKTKKWRWKEKASKLTKEIQQWVKIISKLSTKSFFYKFHICFQQ